MSNAPASEAKENLIKARFDDDVYDQILVQCRRRKVRRAVLIRQVVQDWLDSLPAEQREEITRVPRAA